VRDGRSEAGRREKRVPSCDGLVSPGVVVACRRFPLARPSPSWGLGGRAATAAGGGAVDGHWAVDLPSSRAGGWDVQPRPRPRGTEAV